MSYMLELKNVSFSFAQQRKYFFNKVSVNFSVGALHFLRGQNGAGKSTFFNILRGIVDSQEKIVGTIVVDGVEYNFDNENRASLCSLQDDIKLVQQNFDLMLADQMTFDENLQVARMPLYPSLKSLPEMQKLPTFVERFGIPKNKPVHLLSGGQRQILAILMALQKPTKVLLLDEPTAALDDQNAKMIMEFLQALVQENRLTVLIISHDLELVREYSRQRYYHITVDQLSGERSISVIE